MNEFQTEKKVKTRKEHECCICSRRIPKGFTARHAKGKSGEGFFNVYICNTCYELQQDFPDSVCHWYEGYWDSDTYEDSLTEYDCTTPLQLLNKLRSANNERTQ